MDFDDYIEAVRNALLKMKEDELYEVEPNSKKFDEICSHYDFLLGKLFLLETYGEIKRLVDDYKIRIDSEVYQNLERKIEHLR